MNDEVKAAPTLADAAAAFTGAHAAVQQLERERATLLAQVAEVDEKLKVANEARDAARDGLKQGV